MQRLRTFASAAAIGMSSLGLLACSGSTDSAAVGSTTSALPVLPDFTVLPANEPHTFAFRVHCGAAVFRYELNGTFWRTAEAPKFDLNWLPAEWGDPDIVEQLNVVLTINAAGDRLEATYAGRTVVYTPTELTAEDYHCD